MKSKAKYYVPLNYNSLTEEMFFDNNGEKMAIGKNKIKDIDTVFLND